MNQPARSLTVILLTASLLVAPAFAQLNDGKPDPDFPLPERLDLQYALAFALDNNFDIRQAKERIKQQEGVVLEVKAPLIPNVSAGGSYQRNAEEVSVIGRDSYWNADITARQLLYAGGGARAGVKNQQLVLDAAILELQAVINNALFDVRTRFFTVIVARETIRVQEQSVELLQSQLKDVSNRYDAGTVSKFEVLRAEVALANGQPPLITARNDYRIAIEELRRALGFVTTKPNANKTPEFLGSLEFKAEDYDLVSALSTAREQRPDLQRLVKLESAAEEGITISRAGYYPNLSLYGSYEWLQSPFGSSRPSLDGWVVGVQSQWNIFDGRATKGKVVQSKSQLEQTKLALAGAQLAVDIDVRRAISQLQEATELAAASRKVVEQAEESVRLADARFGAGTATQLDVLQAQTALTTARLNQLQAYYNHTIATASVRLAMGLTDELRPSKELQYPTQ
jgi:outer membrane protein TolC